MLNKINFVKERRKQLSREKNKDRKWFSITILVFILVVVMAVVVMAANLFFSQKIKTLRQHQVQLENLIKNHQTVELEYNTLLRKLNIVSQLFGERKNKQEALAYFSNLFDSSVKVSGLNYSEKSKSLTFSLDIPSVFKLDEVFKVLDSTALKQRFGQVEKHSLTRNSLGHYTISVSVLLVNQQGKKVYGK